MDCGVGSLDFGTSGNQLGVKEWYPTSLIINDDITYVNSENPVIEHYYILTTVVDKISNPMVLIGDGIYSDVQYIEYVQ